MPHAVLLAASTRPTWPDVLVFAAAAAVILVGALGVVLSRNPVHAALSLVMTLFGVAVLFIEQEADFLAAVQIIVYGGAIMVLFVFVIMLLNAGEEERTNFSKLATYAGIPLAVATAGLIAAAIVRSSAGLSSAGPNGTLTSTKTLSMLLFREFVYPFELTSFLILVAILGAIVLAQREN